jgi:hypothetical protein
VNTRAAVMNGELADGSTDPAAVAVAVEHCLTFAGKPQPGVSLTEEKTQNRI